MFAPNVNNFFQHGMFAEPERKESRVNLTFFVDIIEGDEMRLLKPLTDDMLKHIPPF